jgi:hypothetical protein
MTGQHRTQSAPRRPADSWCLVLLSSLAWLILSGIVLRLTGPAAAMVLLAAVFLLGASDQVLEHARCSLSAVAQARRARPRRGTGAAPHPRSRRPRGRLSPAADALAFLLAVVAVALAGGLIPAVIEAVAGSLLPASDGSYWRPWTLPGESSLAGSRNSSRL